MGRGWEMVAAVRCKNCRQWFPDDDVRYGENCLWGYCPDYGRQPEYFFCEQGFPKKEEDEE